MYQKKFNIAFVSICAGILIGLCVIVLSITHAQALFERAGYSGVFSWIGVAGFELTFILGTLVVIWSNWAGEKVGHTAYFVLILGVLINIYSNVTSGIAKGKEQLIFGVVKGITLNESILIGALIPTLFIVAEMVVTDAIKKHRQTRFAKVAESTEKVSETDNDNDKPPHEIPIKPIPPELDPNRRDLDPTDEESTPENEESVNGDSVEKNPLEVATEFYKSQGQLPKISQLAEMAQTSEWKARNQLKAQIS